MLFRKIEWLSSFEWVVAGSAKVQGENTALVNITDTKTNWKFFPESPGVSSKFDVTCDNISHAPLVKLFCYAIHELSANFKPTDDEKCCKSRKSFILE
jgi:hypothetical protein